MYAIHPKSAALVRKYLGLPDDVPVTLSDLARAAEMEATGEHCTRCGRRLSDFGSRDCTCPASSATIAECQSEDRVMHICGEPDRCEETDPRPPVDLLGGER